eukprot:1179373-Prorocentrum_minimum.AAC.9
MRYPTTHARHYAYYYYAVSICNGEHGRFPPTYRDGARAHSHARAGGADGHLGADHGGLHGHGHFECGKKREIEVGWRWRKAESEARQVRLPVHRKRCPIRSRQILTSLIIGRRNLGNDFRNRKWNKTPNRKLGAKPRQLAKTAFFKSHQAKVKEAFFPSEGLRGEINCTRGRNTVPEVRMLGFTESIFVCLVEQTSNRNEQFAFTLIVVFALILLLLPTWYHTVLPMPHKKSHNCRTCGES